MSKPLSALVLLVLLVSPALSQGTYPCPTALETIAVDGGAPGLSFKTGNPSGPSDWFSVDFDDSLDGRTLVALAVSLSDLGDASKNANIGRIGIYPDNLLVDSTGATPDIGNPLAECPSAPANGATCSTPFYFLVPVTHLGDQNVHISYQHAQGDSTLFVCADTTSSASGKSSLSTDSFATPATAVGVDWKIRAAVIPEGASRWSFLINGARSASIRWPDPLAVTFCGPPGIETFPAESRLMAFALCPGGVPTVLFEPILVVGMGGPLPNCTTVCNIPPCTTTVGSFPLCTVYLDPTDTKPSGKPKLKVSNSAELNVKPPLSSCPGGCFGQQDDGAVGASAWATPKPAGTTDWFNVKHGTPSPLSGVRTLTGVEIAVVVSNAACGGMVGNPDGGWAQVGLYPANLAASPAGHIPDIANPLATVAPAAVPNGQEDWAYPATYYDTPDIAASTTVLYHAAVKWSGGDTCLFIAGDDSSAAGPDPCGTIPSSTSFSSSDGYATNAVNFSQVNWLMKIDWK